MIQRYDITGILLAGGSSSRLGVDKRSLVLEGQNLLERGIRALSQFSRTVWVLGEPSAALLTPRLENSEIIWLADQLPGEGPLPALAEAIKQIQSSAVLIAAVDYPWSGKILSVAVAAGRYEDQEKIAGWIPIDGEQMHPLCALYRTELWRLAASRVQAGERTIHRYLQPFMEQGMIRRIPVHTLSGFLANVNTREEWELLQTGGL